jgi:hypothetical protein
MIDGNLGLNIFAILTVTAFEVILWHFDKIFFSSQY